MSPAEAQLHAIVDAWEALPGGRRVRSSDVEEWLADDMAPAINAIRGFLRRPKPDGTVPPAPLYAAPMADREGNRIADAVLSWMVEKDYLDGGNEYRAEDVVQVLNDIVEPVSVPVWVAMGDDHDYDAMSQWLIGVYLSEAEAIEAGKSDEDRYVKDGGKRDRHNVSIEKTTIAGGLQR